jgi:hypothetical protein
VLLMEECFHEPPRRAGDFRPYRYRSSHLVRDDPNDPHSLPVAQRMHTLYEEHQWQAASIYLHEPGSFVPLARLDETMVEPAHLATGTDGRFVQMPATTRHATLFYQNDHLGTPQELVDESGTVVWLARYKAWGGWKNTWKEKPDRQRPLTRCVFRGSIMMKKRGCTITGIGITIRRRGGSSARIRLDWPVASTSINMRPTRYSGLIRWG